MYDWFLRIQNLNNDIIYRDKYPKRWCIYFDENTEWEDISEIPCLSEEFMEIYINYLPWYILCRKQKLSETFIEKHANSKYKWVYISGSQDLSETFIDKHKDQVDWSSVSRSQNLSEAFIEKYSTRVDWYGIYLKQKLSEAFIEKHASNVGWHFAFGHQKVSEPFIEKIIESKKVDYPKCWYNIAKNQNLSKKFITRYLDKWFETLRDDNIEYFDPNELSTSEGSYSSSDIFLVD